MRLYKTIEMLERIHPLYGGKIHKYNNYDNAAIAINSAKSPLPLTFFGLSYRIGKDVNC